MYSSGLSTRRRPALRLLLPALALLLACTTLLASLPASPAAAADLYGVRGNVNVIPRYAYVPAEWKPTAYTVMLDVSGSMNLNFHGWGYYEPQDLIYQCERKDPNYPMPYWPEFEPAGSGKACVAVAPWQRPDNGEIFERRAFAARNALQQEIIDMMNPDDRIRFVAFNHLIDEVSTQWYTPSDPPLTNEVLTIGQAGGTDSSPSFLAAGGTNGSAALVEAYNLMMNEFPDDGITRRPVAIYLTDGVSNKGINAALGVPDVSPEPAPACAGLATHERLNIASCQIGYDDQGRPRPITQMQLLSDVLHTAMPQDFALYVAVAGQTDTTGLSEVATDPNKVYQAYDANELEHMLDDIQQQVNAGACLVHSGEPVTWLAEANKPNPSLTGDPDVFGLVDITQNGNAIKSDVPIVNNAATGRLGFDIPPAEGLPPGTYQITNPRLFYRPSGEYAAQDGELYNRILLNSEYVTRISFTVGSNTPGDTVSAPDMTLDINETRLGVMCDSLSNPEPIPATDPVVQLTDSSGSALPTAQDITDAAQTDFRAIAYDREVSSTDGAGISQAEFTLLDPTGAPLGQPAYDTAAPYCAFGDTNGTCNPMPADLYTQVTANPGTYTLRARTLLAQSGQQTAWQEVSFTTQPQPQVTINFPDGQPGSVFVITGSNFPANAQLSVSINGTQVSTFSADANGSFILVIITSPDATPGTYAITISTGPVLASNETASAQVSYTLDTAAPLREHTAAPGETEIEIDGDMLPANGSRVYLPAVQR